MKSLDRAFWDKEIILCLAAHGPFRSRQLAQDFQALVAEVYIT